MESNLPWNVAGIPPDAREAARASARREGLSVGEWLTRRILRGAADSNGPRDPLWESDVSVAHLERSAADETQEMLARVSRSETESQNAARRIEEQLKNLSRRLEHTELIQSESTRAATRAEVEFEIQSRQQALALDRVAARSADLYERVLRIEQRVPTEGTRDAIKALHHGLSRLADQIAETAGSSADRSAELASALDALTDKFVASRSEEQQAARALGERVSAAETSLGRYDAAQPSTALNALSEKLASCEETQQQNSRALAGRISAAEAQLNRFDAASQARNEETNESRQQAETIAKLSSTIDKISRELTEDESQRPSVLARLEERLSKVEKQLADATADHRLQGFEHTLADVVARMDRSEREGSGIAETLEDELRNLVLRMDAAENHNREAIAELGVLVKETSARIEHVISQQCPAERPAAEARQHLPVTGSAGDMPSTAPSQPAMAFASAATARPILGEDIRADVESFLAAARRNARSIPQTENRFKWPFFARATPSPETDDRSQLRMFLLAGLAFVFVAASSAELFLSQSNPRATVAHTVATHETNGVGVARLASAVPLPHDRLASLAIRGDTRAEELLGLRYLDGAPVNEAEGAKWLERAAQNGEAVAAYRLGTLYEHGQGVPADPSRAAMWYVVAAKAGNRRAMHNLALAYAEGVGVPKNPSLAAQWFARAASLGLADSQFNLGVLYERGIGVPQNLVDAYKWYAIAASEGDSESQTRIDALSSQLDRHDTVVARKAASDFRAQPENHTANTPPDTTTVLGG